jgi:hypothetical protein
MAKIRDKVNSNATDVKYSRLPRKGKVLPNMVRFTEAALIVAFFVVVHTLRLYYLAYSRTDRFRFLLASLMPVDQLKNHKDA